MNWDAIDPIWVQNSLHQLEKALAREVPFTWTRCFLEVRGALITVIGLVCVFSFLQNSFLLGSHLLPELSSTQIPCIVFLCFFYNILYKVVFFSLWLSLAPLSYILVELIFYFGTAKIPDHILEKWVDYIFFCYFNSSLLRLWREDSSPNTTFSSLWTTRYR